MMDRITIPTTNFGLSGMPITMESVSNLSDVSRRSKSDLSWETGSRNILECIIGRTKIPTTISGFSWMLDTMESTLKLYHIDRRPKSGVIVKTGSRNSPSFVVGRTESTTKLCDGRTSQIRKPLCFQFHPVGHPQNPEILAGITSQGIIRSEIFLFPVPSETLNFGSLSLSDSCCIDSIVSVISKTTNSSIGS